MLSRLTVVCRTRQRVLKINLWTFLWSGQQEICQVKVYYLISEKISRHNNGRKNEAMKKNNGEGKYQGKHLGNQKQGNKHGMDKDVNEGNWRPHREN